MSHDIFVLSRFWGLKSSMNTSSKQSTSHHNLVCNLAYTRKTFHAKPKSPIKLAPGHGTDVIVLTNLTSVNAGSLKPLTRVYSGIVIERSIISIR